MCNESLFMYRSSHWRCSAKKGVLRNFTKFTGNDLLACSFIKKETLSQVFSWEFCEIYKNIFSTEHLRTIASVCNEQKLRKMDSSLTKRSQRSMDYVIEGNWLINSTRNVWICLKMFFIHLKKNPDVRVG